MTVTSILRGEFVGEDTKIRSTQRHSKDETQGHVMERLIELKHYEFAARYSDYMKNINKVFKGRYGSRKPKKFSSC